MHQAMRVVSAAHSRRFPQLGSRFNMTARVAKGMVHQELNFLRRQRTEVLQQFVDL